MRIELLPDPEGDTVAVERDADGARNGDFIVAETGRVLYRSPHDDAVWDAGPSLPTFRAAAVAWNTYSENVRLEGTEEEQLKVVHTLRSRLRELQVLDPGDRNLWTVLLQQAEHGLL